MYDLCRELCDYAPGPMMQEEAMFTSLQIIRWRRRRGSCEWVRECGSKHLAVPVLYSRISNTYTANILYEFPLVVLGERYQNDTA